MTDHPAAALLCCKISIPNTHRDCFDYALPNKTPSIGTRVWVPFRNKERQLGIVIGIGSVEKSNQALKNIAEMIDNTPILSEELLNLCHWISTYYHAPLSEILPLALPKYYRRGDERHSVETLTYFQLQSPHDIACAQLKKNARRQAALVNWLAKAGVQSQEAILRAGFQTKTLSSLLLQHIICSVPPPLPKGLESPLQLNEEQAHAASSIRQHLDTYRCFLLYGVTGSGKTEVYLQVIADVLAKSKQVLVLVPEIGLTPQLLARFTARFHTSICVIHSHLSDKERLIAWQRAADNQAQLIIGTRSAIFTPLPALGLIIVDEEHDASFKQMDKVRYSARDTALIRAHMKQIPIILGSATPSLESLHNCNRGKYQLLRLQHKALNSAALFYQIVDIRNQPLQHGLSKQSIQLIQEHLNQDNQVLLFLNRRGFAPVLLCHQCGWMADCRACDTHLTLHKQLERMLCHHCGVSHKIPKQCHRCASHQLLPVGVGTQRIHEHLSTLFPHTTIARIDRDSVRSKHTLENSLDDIATLKAKLIIGTQMLAKGHHFPRLTLVIILDADNGFYNQDFRALEQLGQLLIQVSGRAGRADRAGHVVIQTHLPEHPALNTLIQQGYDAFAKQLLHTRKEAQLPPYGYLALLRMQGRYLDKILKQLHTLKQHLSQTKALILGPAPAPLARKANQHRVQLLIQTHTRKERDLVLTAINQWFAAQGSLQGMRWNIDVDPLDLS